MSDSCSESLTRRIWGATWRIGAFILVFALCMTPVVVPLARLAPADGGGFGPGLQAMLDGAGLFAILAASAIMVLAVDRRPFSALGLGARGFPVHLALGALLGTAMIALAGAGLVFGGVAELDAGRLADRAGLPLAALSGALNVATQDLLIAGYAYLVLAPRFGSRAAASLLSILFVGLHAGVLAGADAAIPALNLFLAGVLLISCRAVTGSLWLTMGVHFAWNYLQGPVLGLTVTGQSLTENPPVLILSGPNWITGGAFGFEGGVAATAATAAGVATVWLVGRNPVVGSKSTSGH
jgi:membrane protease YdiL (CAAX protease family)